MKTIILAGGFGSRLSEETDLKPKPMVEIGGKPILWHILNIYAHQGFKEFIIALGYKGEIIKQYFLNYYTLNSDVTVDLNSGETTIHDGNQLDWKIHLVDTGLNTQTGGRIRRLDKWIGDDETFMFTYGDGVADVDLNKLMAFHKNHGKLVTATTVRSPARFGRMVFEEDRVVNFFEKPQSAEGWINGGFFALQRQAIEFVDNDESIWEVDAVNNLTQAGELMGYRHFGFWSCMDTLKEKNQLETMWSENQAPWRLW